MDLNKPSKENLQYILEELKDRLGVANKALLDAEDYDLNRYDDLKFLYDHVVRSKALSPAETDAFIDELRTVRKN